MKALVVAFLLLTIGCGSPQPSPVGAQRVCAFSIVALPAGVMTTEEKPLPAGSMVIAAPGEFDLPLKTLDPTTGEAALTLRLRGAAVDRVARHSADHVGDLIAITLDGKVIAVPMIMEPIQGNEVTISQGGVAARPLSDQLEGCLVEQP